MRNSSLLRSVGAVLALSVPFGSVSAEDWPDVDRLPKLAGLPDPLLMFDGSPVQSADAWHQKRRPELKRLFQHYMYGYLPQPPRISASREADDVPLFGGKAVLCQVAIRFPDLTGENVPVLHLALCLPRAGQGPSPVFLAINKCGNHTVVADPGVIINENAWMHSHCTDKRVDGRGAKRDFWCVDYLISRGYGFATFHESDIDPDQPDFSDGIHPHYPDLPGPRESRWGTIAAWAWGLHRAVDYLATDDDVDRARISVIGHSRRGKTALLAGAFDERIALVVPHQSGTGGCALSRNNDQETVERINRVFPHWFNDMYPKFAGQEARLPIDQHLLMALVAPRPLLDTAGLEDTWANYESAYRAMRAADAVYKFLGAPGMLADGPVAGDEPGIGTTYGNLVQYRRNTGHTLNRDYWKAILDFADGQLAEKPGAPK